MDITQVPTGYKVTDLGALPEDWEVKSLGDLTQKVGSGITPTGGNKVYKTTGRPFVRSQNVGWGVLLLEDIAFLDEETHNSFISSEIKENDVLLNITGASIGRAAIADAHIAKGNVNQHVCIIRPTKGQLDPKYLCSFLLSEHGQKKIDSFQAGGNRQGLNFQQIKSIITPLPPLAEQQAIAAALGVMDELLAAQRARLAKQRALKQGLLQGLLSGKQRLPEFAGEWGELSVKKDFTLHARIGWQGLTTSEYLDEGPYYLVTGTDFSKNKIAWQTCHFVEKYRYDQDAKIKLRVGDLLVTKDGTIGKIAYVDQLSKPATLNSGVFVLRPKSTSHWPLFIFYVFQSEIFTNFIDQLTAGSTIVHFKFSVPSLAEQKAIAAVLSEADAYLAALEAEHAKTQLLKQGMMQNLLTGKLRLV
jgi:type I restriction enzyme S subunit